MTVSQLPSSALDQSVLVVAHPDDEILWFGSIVNDVDHIIICFLDDPNSPGLGEARQRSLRDHPHHNKTTCLALPETGTFNRASWLQPEITKFGLKITGIPGANEVYEQRAGELRDALVRDDLEPLLSSARNIFTHNPWGEYGHAEHVMVHRIVASLAEHTDATLWHSNYVSRWSQRLMEKYLSNSQAEYYQNNVDTAALLEMSQAYKRHDTWTWAGDYAWFPQECYIRGPLSVVDQAEGGWLYPLNYIRFSDLHNPERYSRPQGLSRLRKKLARTIKRSGAFRRNGD